MGIFTQALGLILSLSILVLFHELGHFFFARLFKTRVEKFYLFFNPSFSLLRMKRYNSKWHFSFLSKAVPEEWNEHPEHTEWGIGWIPLGGYCSIAGMIDETKSADNMSSEPQSWEYRTKPAWQRFFIITGGVLVNFILAILIYGMIFFVWGEKYVPVKNAKYGFQFSEVAIKNGFQNGDKILQIDGKTPEYPSDIVNQILVDNAKIVTVERNGDKVNVQIPKDFTQQILSSEEKGLIEYRFPFVAEKTIKGSAAEKAGIQKNDSIIGINDVVTPIFFDFQKELLKHKSKEVTLVYVRNDSIHQSLVNVDENGKIGIYSKDFYEYFDAKVIEYGFFESFPRGIKKGVETLVNYVKQFKLIFTKEGAKQVGGFGAIGGLFPKEWSWSNFWGMTALLSVILAFMNILPIPALDGGHMIFIIFEMITGRKPSDKFLEKAQIIGFILLVSLLVYANGMDLLRLFK